MAEESREKLRNSDQQIPKEINKSTKVDKTNNIEHENENNDNSSPANEHMFYTFSGTSENRSSSNRSPSVLTKYNIGEYIVVRDIVNSLGEQTPHSSRINCMKSESESVTRPLTLPNNREIPLPSVSWADSIELVQLMCYKEDVSNKGRDPNIFDKHPYLKPNMRAILFDWLMEVCFAFKMRRVTYYLAIDYVDRYLSRIKNLPKGQFQLLGITCLYIASKVEETFPPKVVELAYVTDCTCTIQEIILKELAVIWELNWDLTPTTVSDWLNLYLQIGYRKDTGGLNKLVSDDNFIYPQFSAFAFVRASHLVDLCSLDSEMLKYPYSVIAASSLFYIYGQKQALYVSGLTWDEIKDCVEWMVPFFREVDKMPLLSPVVKPIDWHRIGFSLKKTNPNILVNEAYCVQTHMISLKMLERVYGFYDDDSSFSGT